MELLHKEKSEKIIKSFYDVYNELGHGFLEKVYERALILVLKEMNLKVESQKEIPVFFRGINIGTYYADILVDDSIILELKAGEGIHRRHIAQCLHYLKATGKELGFVMNFGKRPEFKRVVRTAADYADPTGTRI